MKLWEKSGAAHADKLVESFTTGSDRDFDLLLAPYDVQGTQAHIAMLHQVGLLSGADFNALSQALNELAQDIAHGRFQIQESVEDVHSQIELLLTERLGEAGKRVHTGRSRNDQVALDIKLFLRDALQEIKGLSGAFFDLLISLSEQHKHVLMPGYTHLQIAMPSSFGLWFAAWAECLVDDMELLAAAYSVCNKNPLGSAAGYGSSFPLDRKITSELLGFHSMHYNVIAAQMSRGRTEKIVAMSLAALASTLGRMSMDVCLYAGQDFGFFSFPDVLSTGSSIMPHKKNPDIFELIRARCNRIQALPNELSLLLANLPSGYHRDLQLTKEILFPGIQSLKECLNMLLHALPQIRPNPDILAAPKYQYLFSVEAVNELVIQGLPFREAYQTVGQEIESGNFQPKAFNPATHTLTGAMGNLALEQIRNEWEQVMRKF
ncbi:MAG: argininosuccinate lyase [Bacteroidetes bacterium]|nr:argininosuccinate lyase [Bacteroidota bacterium]MBS1628587.1 argininosuccinate lyase [Bacteroidota bacterium]